MYSAFRNFIALYPGSWKRRIAEAPYNCIVKTEGKYTIVKYNQFESDFSNPVVIEARGIIVDDNNKIVCFPFCKFFNYGEPYAQEINWATATVWEKCDGSLIKLWFDNGWHVSTNGSIDAYRTKLDNDNLVAKYKTFGELFDAAVDFDINMFDKRYTHMFELCSPYNQIVVKYSSPTLYYLGSRNMETLEEEHLPLPVNMPGTYPLTSLSYCIAAAEKLGDNAEGFVVCDNNYHRIKVKNPLYILKHHLVSSSLSTSKLCDLIKSGEIDEVIAYFTQYQDTVKYIRAKAECKAQHLVEKREEVDKLLKQLKAEYVEGIRHIAPYDFDYFMKVWDDHSYKPQTYINNMTTDNYIRYLGVRDDK